MKVIRSKKVVNVSRPLSKNSPLPAEINLKLLLRNSNIMKMKVLKEKDKELLSKPKPTVRVVN